ncbi:hypothetical protein GW17_00052312 [Ensete ventricosum]|nr:hypothetical protein GW17_00052312 [Ensete ventricosum]
MFGQSQVRASSRDSNDIVGTRRETRRKFAEGIINLLGVHREFTKGIGGLSGVRRKLAGSSPEACQEFAGSLPKVSKAYWEFTRSLPKVIRSLLG